MRRRTAALALAATALAVAGCGAEPIRPPAGGVRSLAPAATAAPSASQAAPSRTQAPATAAHAVFIELVATSCGPGQGEDDGVVPPPGDQAGVEQLPTANRWKVTDANGAFLLMDVAERVVTGATEAGLAAELPEPYALGCDPEVFLPAD